MYLASIFKTDCKQYATFGNFVKQIANKHCKHPSNKIPKEVIMSFLKNLTIASLISMSAVSIPSFAAGEVKIPYFNTNSTMSTRFGITNPTDKKVAVSVNIFDVDGKLVDYNHFVLEPHDMVVSGISPSKITEGGSRWYIPSTETSCSYRGSSIELPITEGYMTIESRGFTTAGPAGFCGNDYETVDVNKLNIEYSYWDGSAQMEFYQSPVVETTPTKTTWSTVSDYSTDRVINLTDFNGQCQSFEYLIANRSGDSFQTYDTTEPGPGGYINFELCHKVNIIRFGNGGVFDSDVAVNVSEQSQYYNNINTDNGGWMQLITGGTSETFTTKYK